MYHTRIFYKYYFTQGDFVTVCQAREHIKTNLDFYRSLPNFLLLQLIDEEEHLIEWFV